MKKTIFFLFLALVALFSCNKSGHNNGERKPLTSIDSFYQWKDSIGETNLALSFKGMALGSIIQRASKVYRDTDEVFTIDYSSDGTMSQEKNVHRTTYSFEGRVFQIIIDTDNLSVYELIANAYKKQLCFPFNYKSDVDEVKFRNGTLIFEEKDNDYFKKVGQYTLPNNDRDERFDGSMRYRIMLTDSVGFKKFESAVRKAEEFQKSQARKKELEIRHKDDSANSILEKQIR